MARLSLRHGADRTKVKESGLDQSPVPSVAGEGSVRVSQITSR
jgi:hypothetical protein